MAAVVALEGVLRTETGDPIPEGLKLFRTLAGNYRVVISTDGTLAEAEHWLKQNMVFGYAEILGNETSQVDTDQRTFHLQHLLSRGRVELLVDPDADRCRAALELNVACLLYAAPKFVRTRRPISSWTEIKEQVDKQRQAVADQLLKTYGSRWE